MRLLYDVVMGVPNTIRRVLAQDSVTLRKVEAVIAPRFEAYLGMTREVARTLPTEAVGVYLYPSESVISDLGVFLGLFAELFEATKNNGNWINVIQADSELASLLTEMTDEFEFWSGSTGESLARVNPIMAGNIASVWRTMRNGFSHLHWHYEDLSAVDYWNAVGWDVNEPRDSAFSIASRPANNYTIYLADGIGWGAVRFWQLQNLRIIVVKVSELRWHLHRVLSYFLLGSDELLF